VKPPWARPANKGHVRLARFNAVVGDTEVQRIARRLALDQRRALGVSLRQLREDAGLSLAVVARGAGIHGSYLRLIEEGERDASNRVLAILAVVLGADLNIRLYPNTGPRVHDRIQAPMVECLIRALHERWIPSPEVVVTEPARGVIDVVLGERQSSTLIATELNSELRRLEQQIRWHREKEQSLPSSDLWRFARAWGPPETSRLLVLRNTAALRDLANAFESTLHASYPARTRAVVDALRGTTPWPGAGIAWIRVNGSDVRLLDSPPRGVRLGR